MARIVVYMKTNLAAAFIHDKFLERASNHMVELFNTQTQNVDIEIQTNVKMIRNGSTDSMINIDVHHNSDEIDQNSKIKKAIEIAKFIQKQLKLPKERTMVLFFDTRLCTREADQSALSPSNC